MPIIAELYLKENGEYRGKLKTLTLNKSLGLVPIDHDGDENKPVYRTYVGGCEAGGGWNRVSRDGNDYIAVQIDGPELPGPIYANLITSTDPETGEARYFLMWNRKKDD